MGMCGLCGEMHQMNSPCSKMNKGGRVGTELDGYNNYSD